MTTTLSPDPTLSLEDFLQQPETKPASEYIDGRVYQKPMPQGKHSRLQTRLASKIKQVLEPPRLGSAFTELRCTFASRSLVPDITVFQWERIPINESGEVENQFLLYPDWTIEILPPDQRPTRVINNILFCLNQGTRLGWLIDPEERTVIVFEPNQQPVVRDGDPDPLNLPERLEGV
jgi:Uma2 family endonuclease